MSTSRFALVAVALPFVVACQVSEAREPMTNAKNVDAKNVDAKNVDAKNVDAKNVDAKSPVDESDSEKIEIPQGSGDYRDVLALARRYQSKKITYEELERTIIARKLPPHPIGDGYLMIPVPMPPPGIEFNPRMMPKDWEGTWGEVAMAYWLSALTLDEYNRLHKAAHPQCEK